MRFVAAIVAFVLAAAAVGLGVAQRTVLLGPPSVSSSVQTGEPRLTVIDAATLNVNAGTQGIEVTGPGDLMLAYGRTADVLAWIGDATYNNVGWDAQTQELTSEVVTGSEDAAEVPTPVGSDLWLREFTGTDLLTRKINAPDGISVLIAVDTSNTTVAPADGATDGATDGAADGETDVTTDEAAADTTTQVEHHLAARQLGPVLWSARHRRNCAPSRGARTVPLGARARPLEPRPASHRPEDAQES